MGRYCTRKLQFDGEKNKPWDDGVDKPRDSIMESESWSLFWAIWIDMLRTTNFGVTSMVPGGLSNNNAAPVQQSSCFFTKLLQPKIKYTPNNG